MNENLVKTDQGNTLTRKVFNGQLKELIESKIYNHGLNTLRQFEFQDRIYQSPPIKIYDRRIFLSRSIENKINNFSVMDVVNLRQADMAIDGIRGNRSADLLLNELTHSVVNYLNNYNRKNNDKKIEFCRYGGNEFVFSYRGLKPEEIKKANLEIQSLIGQADGFYKPNLTGEKIVKRKIEVEFKSINKPEDDFGKAIFDHFTQNGSLLKEEEINKLKNKFGNYEKFTDWQKEEKVLDFYPENYRTVDDKLKYLSKLNPLLEKKINDLIYNANNLGEDKKFQLYKELESIFIDPLLKSPLLSASDVIDNIKAGNVSHVWTKDLKFLKQFNNISYADGDNAVKTLWKEINMSISKVEQEKLIFARNGGTFIIGLKMGEKLSPETTKKLGDLTKINYKDILSEKGPITVEIGSFDHEINPKFAKKKYGLKPKLSDNEKIELMNLLAEENKLIFIKSDDQFYHQLAYFLMRPNHIFDRKIQSTYWNIVFSKSHTPFTGLFPTSLIHDYFISKRAVQHLTGLEKALDNLQFNSVMGDFDLKISKVFGGTNDSVINEQLREIRQGILKKIRSAMNYAYTHSMLEQNELQDLNNILTN